MKTLEVTDEQYTVIQQLREEISSQVVGKYGYVRERDAVQFLIDNLDGDLELEVGDTGDSSATDDVAASVAAELDDRASVTFDEEEDGVDDENTDDLEGESSSDGDGDPDADDEADEEGVDTDKVDDNGDESEDDDASDDLEEDDEDGGNEDDADEGDATHDGEGESSDDGAASDDDMLNRMMNLLDTHDDKWEESPSADYRYRVTLPDGTTEDVQTKDDVRALLFQHY